MLKGNTVLLKSLRVVGISIRNYQCLEAWDLDQDALVNHGNFISICGENSNGKSSAAEAIAIGLGLKSKTSVKQPVRRDAPADKGYGIKIDIGDPASAYVIQHWSDPAGKAAGFKVTRAEDGKPVDGDPSTWMKEVLGGLRNPVDILQMEPAKLRLELIRIAGIDVDEYDAQIAEAKQREKSADDAQKAALARAERLPWHEDAPEKEESAGELSGKLQYAISDNASITRQIGDYEASVKTLRSLLWPSTCEALVEDVANCALEWNMTLRAGLVDLTALQTQLANVEANNRKFRSNAQRIEAKREWEAAEVTHKEATDARKAAEAAKKKAIAEASYPVEGLGFDEKEVTYNGVPFSQAGHAERIRVAVAICLAGRCALPFLLIDDAECLDKKSLKLLIEEVDRQGAQCLAFFVANRNEDGTHDRDCSFYVVNGALVKAPPPKTEGKGGEGEKDLTPLMDALAASVAASKRPRPRPEETPAPLPCPTCGGMACGAFCMNGDAA